MPRNGLGEEKMGEGWRQRERRTREAIKGTRNDVGDTRKKPERAVEWKNQMKNTLESWWDVSGKRGNMSQSYGRNHFVLRLAWSSSWEFLVLAKQPWPFV